MTVKTLHFVFVILILFICQLTTASKSSKTKKNKVEVELKSGPQNYTVFEKNLVSEKVSSQEILTNYKAFFRETDEFRFDGLVLGYVTPWNNHGYDVAKIFGNKFTHISPVWLQLKRKGPGKYEIQGTHDIDKEWMAAVRNAGRERRLKIVPRILFDGWTGNDYTKLLTTQEEVDAVINILVKVAQKYKFGGYVLEVWSQIASPVVFEPLINLIRLISDGLTFEDLEIILVIPPKRGKEELFTDKHFEALYDYVAAFSLMTYDFSDPRMPGPNAPLPWVEDCVASLTSDIIKREKILTGLNFYGNDYSMKKGGPIVAHEYINALKYFEGELQYDAKFAEHFFKYKDDNGKTHLVFYPTLYSINKRLQLIQDLNTGISIWELGQGLDYFYDLL